MTTAALVAVALVALLHVYYNGFLAAGLLWGLCPSVAGWAVAIFFLGCVIVAGVFGAFPASRKILWVQAVPGAIALALVLLARARG
jgi:putative membrane protein